MALHIAIFVVISLQVRQFADICLFSAAQYKCTVAEAESE
jgi:beta-arrestin